MGQIKMVLSDGSKKDSLFCVSEYGIVGKTTQKFNLLRTKVPGYLHFIAYGQTGNCPVRPVDH